MINLTVRAQDGDAPIPLILPSIRAVVPQGLRTQISLGRSDRPIQRFGEHGSTRRITESNSAPGYGGGYSVPADDDADFDSSYG